LRATAGEAWDAAKGEVLAKHRPRHRRSTGSSTPDGPRLPAEALLFRNPASATASPSAPLTPCWRTKIVTPKDEYQVDYEMREREGRWVATDVIVEGIGLTENYREQFSSLLRDRSFAELLDLMRRKTQLVRESG
jgi:hypothetical protein